MKYKYRTLPKFKKGGENKKKGLFNTYDKDFTDLGVMTESEYNNYIRNNKNENSKVLISKIPTKVNINTIDPLVNNNEVLTASKININTDIQSPNHNKQSKNYPGYEEVIGPDVNGITKIIGYKNKQTNEYMPKYNYGGSLPKYKNGGKKFLAGLAGFGTGLLSAVPGIGQPISNAIGNSEIAEEDAFQVASPIGQGLGNVGVQAGLAFATGGLGNAASGMGTGAVQQAVGNFKYGGKMNKHTALRNMYKKGGMINYNGSTHENGGIPIDQNMKPVSRANAVAEVEDGEVAWNNYIFSNHLKPKRRF